MDDKSLTLLEFPKIREILASFTSFSASRELALSLLPSTDSDEVSRQLRLAREARRLLELYPEFSLAGAHDVRPAVQRASLEVPLETTTYLEIRDTLAITRRVRSALARLPHDFPLLWGLAEKIAELPLLEREIGQCLNDRGEVMDSATPTLAKVRHEAKEVHEQLRQRLEAFINSPRGQRLLQEPLITIREGRYVLPVKIELRREMKGIVHDVSDSGATLFVEPWATVELGNTWRELKVEEEREVRRLLLRLSRAVAAHQEAISQNVAALAEIDLALAKARYGRSAQATEPKLVAAGPEAAKGKELRLVNARHPLLKGEVVPLTVTLGGDFSILVITGPNTGGKTVALKTLGLLSLMTQAGIPIPASEESQLPVFDGIFADIGDEQSIEQSLSTFSWHMGNIIRILKEATARSFVLLDELGTGTDPNEGSALARAILQHLRERGPLAVVTTHHGDLKVFAYATPGLQNASLEFDPVTLSPTYRLAQGLPGGSNAMAIAARLGLPEGILNQARSFLAPGAQEIEGLLAEIHRERDQGRDWRQSLEQELAQAREARESLQRQREEFEREKDRWRRLTREEIETQARELQKRLRRVAAHLKDATKSGETLEAPTKELAAIRQELAAAFGKSAPPGVEPTAPEKPGAAFAVGDKVWLPELGLWGVITVPPDGAGLVEVQVGETRMRLSLSHLEKKEAPSGGAAKPPALHPPAPSVAVPLQLDLRGQRAEQVAPRLERYLNDAFLAGLSQVRIIHGKGMGILRQVVRDLLQGHPLVKSFHLAPPAEGGEGATIVNLAL